MTGHFPIPICPICQCYHTEAQCPYNQLPATSNPEAGAGYEIPHISDIEAGEIDGRTTDPAPEAGATATPRTDDAATEVSPAARFQLGEMWDEATNADFARQLEREVTQLNARLDKYHRIHEPMVDRYMATGEALNRCSGELAVCRDKLESASKRGAKELTEHWAQREKLRMECDELKAKLAACEAERDALKADA